MPARRVELIPLTGLPEIEPGSDLGALLRAGLATGDLQAGAQDVLAVAQKIVSKSEGRFRRLDEVAPGAEALQLAQRTGKDPRLVQLILQESQRVLAYRAGVIIVEHRLGHVTANAGIDRSNVPASPAGEQVLLLPQDPDASAAALRAALAAGPGAAAPAVVITDTIGRAWRNGVVGTALGAAGLPALRDLRGRRDRQGRALQATLSGFADEIAAAASLLMGQADEGCPVVLLRGLQWREPDTPAASLLRERASDLFR